MKCSRCGRIVDSLPHYDRHPEVDGRCDRCRDSWLEGSFASIIGAVIGIVGVLLLVLLGAVFLHFFG